MSPFATIEKRLGQTLRLMLSSDQPGEVAAARDKALDALRSVGMDLHAFTEHVLRGAPAAFSDAELERVYKAGFDDGENAARARAGGPQWKAAGGSTAGPSIKWHEASAFVRKNKDRLRQPRAREFAESIFWQTRVPNFVPSERQKEWLRTLYAQCGGRNDIED